MIKKLFLERKCIKMDLKEFCQYSRNEISLEDIYCKNAPTEEELTEKLLVFVIASGMIINRTIMAHAEGIEALDKMGGTIVSHFISVGKWVFIIMAFKEVLTCILQQDSKGVGQVLLKNLIAYGSFRAIPVIFDFINKVFAEGGLQ